MIDFKSYQQRSSIGIIHSFRAAFKITNPTVAGRIVSILPLVQKSSLQQKSVLICHLVDASSKKPPNEASKKLKVLFIGNAAETVATLPIHIGDEVSFRSACFVCDSCFEKMNSFYEMMLCIGSPQPLNLLRNMFYRKKDTGIWCSLIEQGFQCLATNFDDYKPVRGVESELYVLKSNENSFADSPRREIPSFTLDDEFEFLQSSFQMPEKSLIDAAGESSNITKNASKSSEVPREPNGVIISAMVAEDTICDKTSHSEASDSENSAVPAEATENSISVLENRIVIPEKTLNHYLYLMSRTITKYPSKSNELEERAARDVVNSPQNAFVRLPRKIPKAPFFIQVSVLVTLPYITGTSSDISILSLIGFYCGHCSMYFSFPNVEWQFSDGETLALCSCCAKKGMRTILDCSFMCEFLLQSEFGSLLPAVVLGEDAQNFFGCAVSDLYSSSDALMNIRHTFASFKKSREYLVLKVIPVCYGNDEEYRYHIMC